VRLIEKPVNMIPPPGWSCEISSRGVSSKRERKLTFSDGSVETISVDGRGFQAATAPFKGCSEGKNFLKKKEGKVSMRVAINKNKRGGGKDNSAHELMPHRKIREASKKGKCVA